jgi:ppGpp synthetase/RelA/SpoT-type nucleotidyltranferase
MARSTAPIFSRNRVSKAGRAIRKGIASQEDDEVIENFRASHSHVLNAFQASLRNRAKCRDITVAQRLKRRATIEDKLSRRPNFSLTEMQDIAGCRLIFPTLEDLFDFRYSFHEARFSHKLITADDRYDYISKPKDDGYRGIHDVYEYHSRRATGTPWNKLRIELQYRTIYQHAWSTAVEVAGLLTDNEHKFGRASDQYAEFFCLTSEIIGRTFEGRKSCRPDFSIDELFQAVDKLETKIGILNIFKQYNEVAQDVNTIGKNTILIFKKRAPEKEKTQILSYDSFAEAVRELGDIEKANLLEQEPYDAVLVRAVTGPGQGSIQSAFRNYFADTRDFVSYLEAARDVSQLGGPQGPSDSNFLLA